MPQPAKKVLLVIIDALAARVVGPAMQEGRLPNFSLLAKLGSYEDRCWSIFPSITPAATATLHTGGYPRHHGVAGAFWYDKEKDEVAYFGDDFWVILTEGAGKFFNDFQVRLNEDYLRERTVYERVHAAGKTAACLNSMWFKGDMPHPVHTPTTLKMLPGVSPASSIDGPDVTCLAEFVTSTPAGSDEPLHAPGGMARRFGFHDETTAAYLLDLARRGPMPDLTVAYFPNNDFESHKQGPQNAVEAIGFVDETLGQFFDACGGLHKFLEESAIIITGDHSQSDTLDDKQAREIDLDDVLADFSLVDAGEPWEQGEQLMACPNMRAAQVYLRDDLENQGQHALRDRAITAMLAAPQIDQVIWAEPGADNPERFVVATGDRGRVTFRHTEDGADGVRDEFGNTWSYQGDLAAVGGVVAGGNITFPDYPNAFERVANAFFDEAGHVWATARVGCEFRLPRTSTHPGGSHGALNALDSTAPLITAGVPSDIQMPSPARTVDVIPLCLRVLGVDSPFAPGQGRAG